MAALMSPANIAFDFPVLLYGRTADSTPLNKHRFLFHCWYDYTSSESPSISDVAEVVVEEVRRNAEYLKIRSDSVMDVRMYELQDKSLRPATSTHNAWERACQNVDDAYLRANATCYTPRIKLANVKKLQDLIAVLSIVAHSRSSPLLYASQGSNTQSRRESVAAAARSQDPPPVGATAARRTQSQRDTRMGAVYNYRPLELIPPPITIYHPVFTKFIQMMLDAQVFTHDELDLAHGFVTQAVDYYSTEADRVSHSSQMTAAVHPDILSSIYPFRNLGLDGVVTSAHAPNGFTTVLAMSEVKVEAGEGGCDPIAQAECAYVAVYASDQARPVREASCCPAFLIGVAGPNIIVSGAVFADQFIAQTLTDYISVIPRLGRNGRSPLDDAGYRVARLFRALKACIEDLDEYYAQLVQKMTPPPLRLPIPGTIGAVRSTRVPTGATYPPQMPSIIGPHFTTYRDTAGKEVVLTYKQRLDPHVSMRALFVAEARSESETAKVVVKFAYAYNCEAHGLLANASPPLAPQLRYCAHEPSVGLWVVVMDYVEGKKVAGVLTDPSHITSLRKAVTTLHDRGLVFGDLRAPNVMIVGDGVVLVDFDWCGKAGEARYPSDILLEHPRIDWHPGVQRGGLMEKAHDAHFFYALTGQNLSLQSLYHR